MYFLFSNMSVWCQVVSKALAIDTLLYLTVKLGWDLPRDDFDSNQQAVSLGVPDGLGLV